MEITKEPQVKHVALFDTPKGQAVLQKQNRGAQGKVTLERI